jgi:hypothetical protein
MRALRAKKVKMVKEGTLIATVDIGVVNNTESLQFEDVEASKPCNASFYLSPIILSKHMMNSSMVNGFFINSLALVRLPLIQPMP